MANDLSGNILIVDTASADPIYGTSATPGTQRHLVSSISFSGYTDAADTAVVQDANGVIHTFNGDTDLAPQSWDFGAPVWLTGLRVTTLGSGVVQIATV